MGRAGTQDVESNHETSAWRDWAAVFLWSVIGYLCIIVTVVGYFNPSLLPVDPTALVFNKNISPFFAFSQGSGHYHKPHGVKVVALVPFHYHERTEILDCYLQVRSVHSEGMRRNLIIRLEKLGSQPRLPRPGRLYSSDLRSSQPGMALFIG